MIIIIIFIIIFIIFFMNTLNCTKVLFVCVCIMQVRSGQVR